MAVLQRRMSSAEFSEWMAYAQIEPFGEERADLRMAILATIIANANRDPKLRPEPFEVSDFMPNFEKPEMMSKEDALMAIDAAMTLLVQTTGGKDLRNT